MNRDLIAQLPQSDRKKAAYATLAPLTGKGAWQFLVIPAEMKFKRESDYSSDNTVGGVNTLQWSTTNDWELTITNMPLSGLLQNKKLDAYVDAIASFLVPQQKSPPLILALAWGAKVFSPCVMSAFSRTEKLWYPDGSLAECLISFTLNKVSESQIVRTGTFQQNTPGFF